MACLTEVGKTGLQYGIRRAKTALHYNSVPPQSLFIISDLDHQGDIEGILEPLCKHEGYQMAQVQRF